MSCKYAPGADENPHTFFNPIFHVAIGNMEANTDLAQPAEQVFFTCELEAEVSFRGSKMI